MMRGAIPVPLDWNELKMIGNVLNITNSELYPFWENRLKEVLKTAGMNLRDNQELTAKMLSCAEKFIKSQID